ncbi:hypothetical protein BH09BAC6_BH09BAC6_29120 [soil metagenome]|jgi:outer membrane protein assembly factor BamB
MRKLLTITLTLAAISTSFYSCIAQPPDASYSMFRGDAKHTGIYPSAAIDKEPHVKWKFRTNGFVNSSAAIAGDKIYFGSADSNLYCVDINSGWLTWKFKTGGAVNSSPAIVNGTVFFGSHDGNFYALNAADGKVKWTFKTPGEKRFAARHLHGQIPADSMFVDRWDFWLSSPVVDQNKVYFGSGSGYFYALDAETGTQEWAFKTDGIIHSSPVIAFGNVYFGGWDTYMHALDAANGKEKWKFKTGVDTIKHNQTGITGSPLVDGDMLYFGCRDSYLYALDAVSGTLAWKRYNDMGWVSISPVIYGDKVIYSSGSSTRFAALNKMTGDSVYQRSIGSATFASPSIAGSTLYQGTFVGTIIALDVNTGDIKWVFATDACREDKLQILNPDYSISNEKFDSALKKSGGKLKPIDVGLSLGCITSSPVVKNQVIYFGSTDGNFYALE